MPTPPPNLPFEPLDAAPPVAPPVVPPPAFANAVAQPPKPPVAPAIRPPMGEIVTPPMPTIAIPTSSGPDDIFSGLDEKKVPPKNLSNMPTMSEPTHSGSGSKGLFIALAVLVVLIIAGGVFWYFVVRKPVTVTPPVMTQSTTPDLGTNVTVTDTEPVANPVVELPPPPVSPTLEVTSTGDASVVAPQPVTTTPPGTNVPLPDSINNPPATTTTTDSNIDTDQDGLSDQREIELGTDPKNPDTDGDGLTDGDEVLKYATNPLNRDTDGDGYPDGVEVKGGFNPRAPGKCVQADCAAS